MMHCYQYATMFLLIISMSSSHGKSTVNRLSGKLAQIFSQPWPTIDIVSQPLTSIL